MAGARRAAGAGRAFRWRAAAAGLLAALALQAGAGAARAQRSGDAPSPREPGGGGVTVSARYDAIASAGVTAPGSGEDGTLASISRSARFTVPVARTGGDTVWLAGLGASERSLDFAGFSPALTPALVPTLYGASVHGDVVRRLDGDKVLLGYLAVGRYGDQWAPDARGTRATGGGELDFRWREHEVLGLGGAVTYVLGDRRVLPIVRYSYLDKPWAVNVRFPFLGEASYALRDWLRVGGRISAEGGEYAIGSPQASVDTVRTSAVLAGAFLALGRRQGAQLQIGAGRTLSQRYQGLENGNDVVTLNFDRSPYFQVTGLLRF